MGRLKHAVGEPGVSRLNKQANEWEGMFRINICIACTVWRREGKYEKYSYRVKTQSHRARPYEFPDMTNKFGYHPPPPLGTSTVRSFCDLELTKYIQGHSRVNEVLRVPQALNTSKSRPTASSAH